MPYTLLESKTGARVGTGTRPKACLGEAVGIPKESCAGTESESWRRSLQRNKNLKPDARPDF